MLLFFLYVCKQRLQKNERCDNVKPETERERERDREREKERETEQLPVGKNLTNGIFLKISSGEKRIVNLDFSNVWAKFSSTSTPGDTSKD